jgi:hypothetical protein
MKEIIKKMPLREILAMDTGFIKIWISGAQDIYEWEKVWVYFSDGTFERLPYAYEYTEYDSSNVPYEEHQFNYGIYDFVKNKINLIERVERLYTYHIDGNIQNEVIEIIYPEDSLNVLNMRKELIKKIKNAKEDKILYYYYKIFCDYSGYINPD